LDKQTRVRQSHGSYYLLTSTKPFRTLTALVRDPFTPSLLPPLHVVTYLHWIEITYLGVTPLHRRKRIGTQLLQYCKARAHREDLALTVSCEPAGYDLFASRGFRDTVGDHFNLSVYAEACSGFGMFKLSVMIWRPTKSVDFQRLLVGWTALYSIYGGRGWG
jgi:Acetyltransferase (GNAT) domain